MSTNGSYMTILTVSFRESNGGLAISDFIAMVSDFIEHTLAINDAILDVDV